MQLYVFADTDFPLAAAIFVAAVTTIVVGPIVGLLFAFLHPKVGAILDPVLANIHPIFVKRSIIVRGVVFYMLVLVVFQLLNRGLASFTVVSIGGTVVTSVVLGVVFSFLGLRLGGR